MAGFEVTTYGRFWVTAEAHSDQRSHAARFGDRNGVRTVIVFNENADRFG
jgi:hypothetical protein